MTRFLNQPDEELKEVIHLIREKEIPYDMTDRVMEGIYLNQKIQKRRRNMKKKMIVATGIAVAAFILITGSGFVSPTMAESLRQVPIMNSIFAFAGDLGLKNAAEKELAAKPDVKVQQGNMLFTVPEIIYDGTRLSLSVERTMLEDSVQTGEKLVDDITDVTLKINGEDTSKYAPNKSIPIFMHPGATQNSMIVEISDLRNQQETAFPESFILTVSLDMKNLEEPVVMHIPVSKNEEGIIDISPEMTKTEGIYTVTLDRIELTPVTTNISTHLVVSEGIKYNPLKMHIGYEVSDEKGRVLQIVSGNASHEKNGSGVTGDLRLEPFTEIPSKIIIKAYQNQHSETEEGRFKFDEEGNIMKTYLPGLEFEVEIKK